MSLINELAARRHKLLATFRKSLLPKHILEELVGCSGPGTINALFPLWKQKRLVISKKTTSKAKIVGSGCMHSSFHESHNPLCILHRYLIGLFLVNAKKIQMDPTKYIYKQV